VTARELSGALTAWLERLMPDAARRERLTAVLQERFGEDGREAGGELCAEMQAAARTVSRHLDVQWVPEGRLVPDTDPPGWPPQDPQEVAARGASITATTIGDAGVLEVATLDALELAAPFLEQAFEALRGVRAVVLDLRANGGGDPATAAAVLGRLLGPEPVHLSDVVSNEGTQRWESRPHPTQRRPAAALISGRTYSSGEALAYHFQSQRLGPLVGERTPGAADHVTPVVLAPQVRANLPRAYVVDAVTGTNWEQQGVRPDVPCSPDAALERALEIVL
jgi:Peptidase family S41